MKFVDVSLNSRVLKSDCSLNYTFCARKHKLWNKETTSIAFFFFFFDIPYGEKTVLGHICGLFPMAVVDRHLGAGVVRLGYGQPTSTMHHQLHHISGLYVF